MTSNVADRGRVKSVEVGFGVLKAMAEAGTALSLKDLAELVDMPASKVHRYLASLVNAGMVEQLAGSTQYQLGVESLHLGLSALSQLDLVRHSAITMEQLKVRLNETLLLSVWGNNGPTIIKMLEPSRPVTVNVRVGFALPLLSSATGLVFAAHLPKEQIKDMLRSELKLHEKSGRAGVPRNTNQARALIEQVREQGNSRVEGALLAGINSLGAPLFDYKGELAGVLTVLGAADQVDIDVNGEFATELRAAAAEISYRMGAG